MVVIVLIVVTAASVTALFVRGFKVSDLTQQLQSVEVITPAQTVWLVEVDGYNSKTDAYKTGLNAASSGCGVYVINDNEQWNWVLGVYETEAAAQVALTQVGLTEQAVVKSYQIQSKRFSMDSGSAELCKQVFGAVLEAEKLLFTLRDKLDSPADVKNLQLDLTTQYNRIRDAQQGLQSVNAKLQSDFIATVVYTANQNLLGLQDVIGLNQNLSLATVNNALLKTIFSLDNF